MRQRFQSESNVWEVAVSIDCVENEQYDGVRKYLLTLADSGCHQNSTNPRLSEAIPRAVLAIWLSSKRLA